MPGQTRRHTTIHDQGIRLKRGLDARVKIAQHVQRDRIRNADVMELEKILPEVEEQPFVDEGHEETTTDEVLDTNQSEVDLWDEDDTDNEHKSTDFLETPVRLNVSPALSASASGRCFVIVMQGERAIFQIPGTLLGRRNDELALKLQTYQLLAQWLTNERANFICNPSFEALAGNPPEQLPNDFIPPITQEGLMTAIGFDKGQDLFSKHLGHGLLMWPNGGEMPVAKMWSKEAKWAWCAMMALHRQKQSFSSRFLDPSIQPPRDRMGRNKIRGTMSRVWRLPPDDFIKLLCVLADCSWSDVVRKHGHQLATKEN